MPLSKYQKFCYRVFGELAENVVPSRMKETLSKARINIRAGAYLATAWMNAILVTICSAIVLFNLVAFVLPAVDVHVVGASSSDSPFGLTMADVPAVVLLVLAPFGIGALTYVLYLMIPRSLAKQRGKRIDSHLPYALNFISAMSAAGITPHEIFISLSKQDIYGEVREEAAQIGRDISLLGMDIVTALKRAIDRTPSERFKEFLQGAVVTITSGGALKPYFMAKADQYMRENRQTQKTFLETLGVMAEAYVTAAVAGPLFVLIIIPLMMIIQGGAGQLVILYLFVFIVLPLIHLAFAVGVKFMTPEV
ncbi:MAG TPA: secretion system protein [Thermoplasmatales archaeon]|nr:secretion system protein [Thermoplasmatales archaeon]